MIALYIFFILWMTLFTREPRAARIVKGLFWEVRMGYWWDIVLNILLLIPFGFLLGDKGWKAVLFGFLFSAAGVSGFLLTSESVRTDSVLVETAALYSFHFIEIHFLS